MASTNNTLSNDLFSSLISEIKAYSGKDPILPWLRGIRRMKQSLPPQLLNEKLPRFLQKCAQTFQTDSRYRNDLRFIRVWMQLMDFVEDPRAVLGAMEANRIGMKRSLFYQAYALYYEKMKKFDEAEKMYHLGVKNLAEPIGELQRSFEQFLHRAERHKNKRIQLQGRGTTNRSLCAGSIPLNSDKDIKDENLCRSKCRTGSWLAGSLPEKQPRCEHVENKVLGQSSLAERPYKEYDYTSGEILSYPSVKEGVLGDFGCKSHVKQQRITAEAESDKPRKFSGEDTVVVKFVGTAIDGKSAAEDACHHGLVEPTINTKEAMNAINSMFREPLEQAPVGRRSQRTQPKADHNLKNGFEVFIDEDSGSQSLDQNLEKVCPLPQHKRSGTRQPDQEPLQIFMDDEENYELTEKIHEKTNFDHMKFLKQTEVDTNSSGQMNVVLFPTPKDPSWECSNNLADVERPPQDRFREDTVVYRFVGSTVSNEPNMENVCHHGLVEPTVNLKEAMDDINNMFGKPMEFTRKNRPKKQDRALDAERDFGGFLILADEDLSDEQQKFIPTSSSANNSDLFEETIYTKEAMSEINKMFGMPLDF